MKNDKYKNLREKTVYDFCDDKDIHGEITFAENKSRYMEFLDEILNNCSQEIMFEEIAMGLSSLAFIIKDKNLEKEVWRQFPIEMKRIEERSNE